MKKLDHQSLEAEALAGPRAEDEAGAIMDGDEDFNALHALVTRAKGLDKDKDVAELRCLVGDHRGQRLHAALDHVLAKIRERRCTGDRKFLRRVGVKP